MRILELITESDGSSASTGGDTKKKGSFRKDHKNAISGGTRYPNTAAHYYNMYRYGVHMAGNPENEHNFDPAGPTANEMVTVAYTDEERDMHNQSAKAMGFKGKKLSSHGSKEADDTYTTSPVANWNKK
jgi:hypothetical protein